MPLILAMEKYTPLAEIIVQLGADLAAARASLGAIHYHACRTDADAVVLAGIRSECERAVPELARARAAAIAASEN